MTTPVSLDLCPLDDPDEQGTREAILQRLAADPEGYLAEYSKRFGNVFNADNAATLFGEYNRDRAKYRIAAHPAATWIRDELFRRALIGEPETGRNRVVFTAGGNAAGKTTALEYSGERYAAQAVLDSTFSNSDHARQLLEQALASGRAVTVLHVQRPLEDAFRGMLERGVSEGRVVTIKQLISSAHGAVESVRALRREFGGDPRVQFRYIENSSLGAREVYVEPARREDYTEIRRVLNDILDAEYRSGRITEPQYRRIRGRGEPEEPGEPRSG